MLFRISNIPPQRFRFVQNLDCVMSEYNFNLGKLYIFVFLIDTVLIEVGNIFLVDMKVHTCDV